MCVFVGFLTPPNGWPQWAEILMNDFPWSAERFKLITSLFSNHLLENLKYAYSSCTNFFYPAPEWMLKDCMLDVIWPNYKDKDQDQIRAFKTLIEIWIQFWNKTSMN